MKTSTVIEMPLIIQKCSAKGKEKEAAMQGENPVGNHEGMQG
jgi:hypothetical protein